MPVKTDSKSRKPKVGPRTVRAWFDTIINPLLFGLKTEQKYLAEKNWTWNPFPPRLEAIRYVREMIEAGMEDNLEQLLKSYPDLSELIARHDQHKESLFEVCHALQTAIEQSNGFNSLYSQTTSDEALKVIIADPSIRQKRDELRVFVAGHLVNRTKEVLSFYLTSAIWNAHRDKYIALLSTPELVQFDQATARAGELLTQSCDALIDRLKEIRETLAYEHDTPYVASASGLI